MAILADATAKWTVVSVRRASLKFQYFVTSKSRTSPPALCSYGVVSKCVISPMPDRPDTRLSQTVATSFPIGLTTPSPVTTTRLS